MKTAILLAATMAIVAVAAPATALYANADAYANCHFHTAGSYYQGLASFDASAGGTLTDVLGQWSVSGTSSLLPAQSLAGAWPLILSVSIYDDNFGSPPTLPAGTVVTSTASATASALGVTPIFASDPASDTC